MRDFFINEDYQILCDHDGELRIYRDFFDEDYFPQLKEEIAWSQDKITLYGKTHNTPRLQAWYSDDNLNYSYSGMKLISRPWIKTLLEIKNKIEEKTTEHFNGCLCNLYRDGKDYAAWHSDDERELGRNPVIASASFGQERRFVLKHKTNKGLEPIAIDIPDRSLILMSGPLQHHWKHQLNKTAKKVDARINLTFRRIHTF